MLGHCRYTSKYVQIAVGKQNGIHVSRSEMIYAIVQKKKKKKQRKGSPLPGLSSPACIVGCSEILLVSLKATTTTVEGHIPTYQRENMIQMFQAS